MMHDIPTLDRKGLREFGLVTGGIVAGLFGLLFPWLLDYRVPLWPWLVFAVLAAWALAAPGTLAPVYRAWMKFGLLIGRVTTPLILGVVFFFVIMPMGLVMRLAGRDPMARRFDEAAPSYRVPSMQRPKEHMEKPF